MDRSYYLSLAASGLRMPIGADLVLHEHRDAAAILEDGVRLGRVIEETARRFCTPLAIPLMDLKLEKADLLSLLRVPPASIGTFHFSMAPSEDAIGRVQAAAGAPFSQRGRAHIESIRYIADQTDLLPVGMAIGPFSLMTKLVSDPITPLAMAGMGLTREDEPGILMLERCLDLAEFAVTRSVTAQIAAGARAVLICEPAASTVYISPKHIEAGADTFERFVLQPNLRLRDCLRGSDADLIFHNCGQLSDAMVRDFGHRLRPVILSLGSTRKLWEDARLVPKDVVLFGNLPTRSFYSDSAMPIETVRFLAAELLERMRMTGHPFILGSECDVLHVPESAETIRRKVDAVLMRRPGVK